MARFVFEMNMSLDGYVDHDRFAPGVDLFRHFTDRVAGLSGSLYGRRIYDLMRYWEEDQPDWTDDHRAFAEVWRAMPKWVVSRSDPPLGPNATLLAGDLDDALRDLKASVEGEIAVAGPVLAGHLTTLGLIDEYRPYVRSVVLGQGRPYFTGPVPPLRLVAADRVPEDTVRLTYVPV
jgi:dihydrofolate reductase